MKLPLEHVLQTEPHTCGWCACRVVYQHYSVTATKHLRTALKVDAQKIPFIPSSTGVLPWTLLQVLRAEGFLTEVLPVKRRSLTAICRRLDQGHPTIALQGAGESLHWIVIGGHSNDYLHIMDSLSQAPGWRRILKEDALDHFNMFFSVTCHDGQNRKTTILDMMKAVPNMAKVWKMFVKSPG